MKGRWENIWKVHKWDTPFPSLVSPLLSSSSILASFGKVLVYRKCDSQVELFVDMWHVFDGGFEDALFDTIFEKKKNLTGGVRDGNTEKRDK